MFPAEAVMTTKKKAQKLITLARARVRRADDVRIRLSKLGIDEQDVTAAVSWARKVTSND